MRRTRRSTHLPTWKSWGSMVSRCRHRGHYSYPRYGGRGISYCARWSVYENFLADMGERPLDMTLDRIDNNGNYCTENCRWADSVTQSRNKCSNVTLKALGETKIITDWALDPRCRASHGSLYRRKKKGAMSDEEIITTPHMHHWGKRAPINRLIRDIYPSVRGTILPNGYQS